MKKMQKLIKVGWLIVALACVIPCAQAENTVALKDVMKLKDAGVDEKTIVAFIESKNLDYALSAEDIVSLQAKGVSTAVLNAMLASSKAAIASAASAPSPVPSPAPATVATSPAPLMVQPAVLTPTSNPEVAYFYQELSPYGRWILAEDGQWYWQPSVVLNTPGWRPYWDKGRWVFTDQGWYWSSEYSWGWAVFHYGRWQLHPHHGWIWLPDRVWGPSWVVWRTGGDYCGWAPLPPGTMYDTVGGHFLFRGKAVEIGFDFGLGSSHFSFCHVKEMGEPFRRHFRDQPEIRAVYNRTTVIQNYSVNKVVVGTETHLRVVNHGLEASRVAVAKGRNVETIKIQDLHTPPPGRGHERFDNKSKTLEVYRPKFERH